MSRARRKAARPPETIADVLARMRVIVDGLPRRDGVACFTRLYLAVTEAVDGEQGFASPEFLTRLDVRFANLFFDALEDPPRAWTPLIEARSRRRIAPIQFALAGMNAHINRDLPLALVATCADLGRGLRRGSPEHADFLRVDKMLAKVERRVKRELVTGDFAVADQAMGEVDDVIAMWKVERARDSAWTNAETLRSLRSAPDLADAFFLALDRMVGFASRGLLQRVGP